MSTGQELPLPALDGSNAAFGDTSASAGSLADRAMSDLDTLYDVPVTVSAILGHARMQVADLLKIGPGTLLELDRRVGEAVDIRINDRLVARGEVVLVEDRLGVTMTEIVVPNS